MSQEVELFLKIVEKVSDGKVKVAASDPLNTIFHEGLQPLEFELALYSLEATLGRLIEPSFYESAIEDHLLTPIDAFLRQYLSKAVNQHPLFVTEIFKKFHQSASWENQEVNKPGHN
jgi:hypothetical protein